MRTASAAASGRGRGEPSCRCKQWHRASGRANIDIYTGQSVSTYPRSMHGHPALLCTHPPTPGYPCVRSRVEHSLTHLASTAAASSSSVLPAAARLPSGKPGLLPQGGGRGRMVLSWPPRAASSLWHRALAQAWASWLVRVGNDDDGEYLSSVGKHSRCEGPAECSATQNSMHTAPRFTASDQRQPSYHTQGLVGHAPPHPPRDR